MIYKFSFSFLLCFFYLLLYSQKWEYPSVNYSVKDGLPSNEIYDVIQDSAGYMWFATDNGLSRFDGYAFKNYDNKNGLTDRVVFDLQLDKYGRIWMSSLTKKIFVYNPVSDSIYYLNSIFNETKNCSNAKLKYFYFDSRDELRIDCSEGFYTVKISQNCKVLRSHFQYSDTKMFTNAKLYRFFHSDSILFNNNKHWIPSIMGGKKRNYVLKAFYLNDYSAIISTDQGNLYINNELNKTIIKLHQRSDDLIINNDSSIIIAYISNGGVVNYKNILEYLDGKGKVIIEGISCSGMTIDKQGNLWLSTTNEGVFKIKYKKGIEVKHLNNITLHSKAQKYLNEDENNISLFLKNGIHLNISKRHTLDPDLIKIINSQLAQISLKDMYHFYNKKYFLLETLELGEYLNGEYKIYNFPCFNNDRLIGNKLICNKSFPSFYTTSFQGLRLFDITTKECLGYYSSRITDVKQLKSGKLMITGIEGLYEFNNNVIRKVYRNLDPYLNTRIDFIDELPDSTIILASKNAGVYFLKENKIKYLDIIKAYNIDLIKFIELNEDVAWIVTSSSIILLKVKNGKVVDKVALRLGIELPNDQINSLVFDHKYVYIGMDRNLVSLEYNMIFKNSLFAPSPIIEKITANNVEIKITNKHKFAYFENNISIKLLAINHNLNGKIKYRYSLNNDKFIDIVGSRELNFYQLSYGNYHLKFIAENENGIWSKPTELTFTINPPWWRTVWFYILSLVSLLAIVYFYFRSRLIFQKKQADLKEEIRKLEKSALQAQMNPHFIFNSLNSIQKFILTNNKEEASEYLSKFATLIRLNLKASNSFLVILSEEISLLKLYLEMEKLRFKNKFEYTFSIELSKDEIEAIKIPPMLIQPIIENSILHGIANSKNTGLIEVTLKKENQKLLVTVKDNGQGIKHDVNNADSNSYGSKITKRRLELIGGENEQHFSIKNLFNSQNQVIGALAQLYIKL